MEYERVGAAKRRRERRLRSWAKHERMRKPPPQSPKGGGRRARRPTGTEDCQSHWCAARRPDGPEPQGRAGMVGYMPASVPRLQGHRLNGDGGEAVDGTSLRYLHQEESGEEEGRGGGAGEEGVLRCS